MHPNTIHKVSNKMCRVRDRDLTLHVQLIRETLKTRNKSILWEFDQLFSRLITPDYFLTVLSLAMKQLAESDSEDYRCFLQSCYQEANPLERKMAENTVRQAEARQEKGVN
ncbi:MAG TPA: hypothetical protein V6C84_05595 [Coleofasciculaceae cyanobacterium]|jgi:hypothetical protein